MKGKFVCLVYWCFHVFFLCFHIYCNISRLQEQIENIRQKERLDKDLDICNKKMAWMKFEELFIKYRETEDDLKKAKE